MDLLLLIIGGCIPALFLSWKLPERWQFYPLILTSAIFLAFVSPASLIILTLSTLFQYALINRFKHIHWVPLILIVQIVFLFGFFKIGYGSTYLHLDKIIPIGLSYYCFRQISYALDAYKQNLPKHTLYEYVLYLFFLPTFIVGPINRFNPFVKDLRKRRWNNEHFTLGIQRLIHGLFKITVLGNFLFSYKLKVLIESLSQDYIWLSTYLKVLNFFANAYVQLAGFSEVAIGLSLLFGLKIIENFDKPYFALNIVDFWNRWHISLSHWCRDYVFLPFLSLTRNSYISIALSMLVLSLWHEFSFRYILWGGIHVLAISLWYMYEKTTLHAWFKSNQILQKSLGVFLTIHFVAFSFVFVSEENLDESLQIFKIIFGL